MCADVRSLGFGLETHHLDLTSLGVRHSDDRRLGQVFLGSLVFTVHSTSVAFTKDDACDARRSRLLSCVRRRGTGEHRAGILESYGVHDVPSSYGGHDELDELRDDLAREKNLAHTCQGRTNLIGSYISFTFLFFFFSLFMAAL